MGDGINRVELTLVSLPGSTIQVDETQVDTYLANGWERTGTGARRKGNPATGSTPVQGSGR